jgi:aspartyl-tRNA synthetase
MGSPGNLVHEMPDNADPETLVANRYRDTRCGSLRPSDIGRQVRLAGWLAAKRDHGGLVFVDLRDPAGPDADLSAQAGDYTRGDHRACAVQLVSHPEDRAFEVLARLRLESVISVTGEVVARPPDTVNPKLATGEVEVRVASVEVLSTAEVLPFPVERDSDVGEEARLTHRYLDMRRGPLVERLAKRARFCQLVRSHLSGRGFLEVQTPVLTVSSPEGARDYLVPSRVYPGEFYALPQAPQQFKQLLMTGGVERYFQIAPCFRDEASRADRSPGEFYQIDLEMAFATQEDVFREVELLFNELVSSLSSKTSPAPYPRLSYADALARYGTDKPDMRFSLEIADLSAELGGRTELPMFADAPARGHAVRALLAPGCADRPRKWFDSFADAAKGAGCTGSWLQLPADRSEWKGPLSRKLTQEEMGALVGAVGASDGDAVLTCVGPSSASVPSVPLGQVRSSLGHELGFTNRDVLAFCWIIDFPMYERNPDTGGWDFSHNPFSMPQGGLEALESKDPGEILAYQYDVVCNGVELSSGAVRNHLPDVMEKAFAIAGYSHERVERSFPSLWNAFHYGAPPHAGIAPGVDRLLMVLEDQPNIREVIAFPLNQMGRDLLMGAPAPVTAAQLAELHLQVVPPKR